MITEWLMVVFLVASPTNPNIFIFEEPTFSTPRQCIEWVNRYPGYWVPIVREQYPNAELDNVLCVNEEKLRELVPEWSDQYKNQPKEKEEYVPSPDVNGHINV